MLIEAPEEAEVVVEEIEVEMRMSPSRTVVDSGDVLMV